MFPHNLHFFESVTSTQTVAKELLLAGKIANGDVIIAKEQTAGKGRGTHSWHSPAGSLSLTIAFHQNPLDTGGTKEGFASHLPFLTGLAVIETLAHAYPSLKKNLHLRWPNDVLIAGKKVAGVLIEQGVGPEPFILIGIGCNIQSDPLPVDLQTIATTLPHEVPIISTAIDLVPLLVNQFDSAAKCYIERGFQDTMNNWILWWKDANCQVVLNSLFSREKKAGTVTSIDKDGLLVVQTDQHTVEHCDAGAYHVSYYNTYATNH